MNWGVGNTAESAKDLGVGGYNGENRGTGGGGVKPPTPPSIRTLVGWDGCFVTSLVESQLCAICS